jgi:hypothetical protein
LPTWAGLTRDAEPTAALAFNLGLCAETAGEYDAAVDWYARHSASVPKIAISAKALRGSTASAARCPTGTPASG